MVSKRVLLVTVCSAVLIVAVGAYGYALYSQVSSLGGRLDDLQRTIDLLKIRIGFTNSSETFHFCWGGPIAEKFNVTTFWMNVTFQRTNETHLTVTVEVNHLVRAYMGIAFDADHDGEIGEEPGYTYYAMPYSIAPDLITLHYGATPSILGPYREGNQRFFEIFAETTINDIHRCVFDPELGCTYIVPVNIQDILWEPFSHKEVELTNDLIHVEYAHTVAVEFCFGMELIA